MSSINEEMSSDQKKRAKKMMGQLTQNPIAKSSGAGALSPEAAEELGDKAKELRKKKLAKVGLPSIKKEEYATEAKGMSKDTMLDVLKGHKYSKRELLDMSKKSTKEGRHGEAAAFYQEFEKEEYILEREMTAGEMKKEKKLKNKYDTSGMKKSMIDQYGKEKGTEIYFRTIRKQAMANSFDPEGEQIDEVAGLLVRGALAAGGGALVSKGIQYLQKKANQVMSSLQLFLRSILKRRQEELERRQQFTHMMLTKLSSDTARRANQTFRFTLRMHLERELRV